MGVIRNQRSKIRRSSVISTTGGPFRKISKFECRLKFNTLVRVKVGLGLALGLGISSGPGSKIVESPCLAHLS